jgi:hypothetical protein
MIRRSLWVLAALLPFVAAEATAAATLAAGRAGTHQAKTQEFRWQGTVAPGKILEVKGVNGDVEATAAAGSEVAVTASKRGKRSDPASVRIEVLEHAQGVTICAVYPTGEGKRANECGAGEEDRMSVNDNDVRVDFTVRVPAGVRLTARTVNGEVAARGLSGAVDASTVNGSVEIATSATAEASTVNGSIVASLGRSDWAGELELSTVNGGIVLNLPAGLDAELEAQTVNGRITTDFPLQVTRRVSRRRLEGTIGRGGRELVLTTVNGDIEVREASRATASTPS